MSAYDNIYLFYVLRLLHMNFSCQLPALVAGPSSTCQPVNLLTNNTYIAFAKKLYTAKKHYGAAHRILREKYKAIY